MLSKKADEYRILLEMIISVGEAAKGLPTGKDNRLLDAEGLALKFLGHASSIFVLSHGTQVSGTPIDFLDFPSVNVLGRAALEAFLVFHHVFIEPTSEDEKDFRYWAWLLSGLLDRQRYPVISPQGREILDQEMKLISELRQRLRNNSAFQQLKGKQQRKVLNRGKWRLRSWAEMGLAAGLSERLAKAFYDYLCGYAHASSLSVSQIRQSGDAQTQTDLLSTTFSLLMVAMAFMVRSYPKLFPQLNGSFYEDPKKAQIVEIWSSVGYLLPNGD